MKQSELWDVKDVVLIGMFSALTTVLTAFELSLPFIAPSFYGLDLSEIPMLVGTFSMRPLAGVVIELVRVLVKLLIGPTSTGSVSEPTSFYFGCSIILPAGWVYKMSRAKRGAIIGMAVGTVSMAVVEIMGSTPMVLPFYFNFMPLDTIITAGTAINPAISNVWTFAVICVGPFNSIKGFVVSLITALVYKRISIIIRMSHPLGKKQVEKQA